jgi:hypothetical protein
MEVTVIIQTAIQIYLAIVGLASIIVKLTPTLKDDTILLNITKFVAKYIALNVESPEKRPV